MPGVWFSALCDATRSVRSAQPVPSVLSVPFRPFCRSRPVLLAPFRSAAGVVLPRVTALRTGRCLRHPHAFVTSSHLIPSSSLSLGLFTPGVFSSGTRFFVVSACSLSLFWPALSLSVCGLHGAGVLPFPSCRPVPAARFRSGSTDGKEGRVVGKIGKLSVISKSVNPGRSASAGWRLLIG